MFSDRDTSAYKRVPRPAYDLMWEGIEAGLFDAVCVWKLDRLTRRFVDAGPILHALQDLGVELLSVQESIDTATPMGQAIIGVLIAQAEQESRNTSLRVGRALETKAVAGKMHTGGHRQFGYERDGTVRPDEAAAVQEVADRLLTGESLWSVAQSLNERGIKTTTGRRWLGSTLRQMVSSPRLAGFRFYQPEKARRDGTEREGDLIKGDWQPVLSEETWLALKGNLAARNHHKSGRNTNAHLLVGLLVCGLCGKNLTANTAQGQWGRYVCSKRPGSDACGKIALAKDSADRYVRDEWIDFVATAELRPFRETEDSIETLQSQMAGIESKLGDLARDHYISGRLPKEVFVRTHDELTATLEELRGQHRRLSERLANQTRALQPGSREDLKEWWEQASTDQQRMAMRRAISSIRVLPARVKGGNRFDTNRVQIEWSRELYQGWATSGQPRVSVVSLGPDRPFRRSAYSAGISTDEMVAVLMESYDPANDDHPQIEDGVIVGPPP